MPPKGFLRRLTDNGHAAIVRQTMLDDPAFCTWFTGFFDGEGTINIQFAMQKESAWWKVYVGINLRADDRGTLEAIRAKLGGYVTAVPSARAYSWHVSSILACEAIGELFEMYPLRSKKAREVAPWREAIRLLREARSTSERNDARLHELRAFLIMLRTYVAPD